MNKLILWTAAAALCALAACAQTAPPLSPEAQGQLFKQYCATCHNDRSKTGGMTLTQLDPAHPEQNAELAERVIRKLRAGMMPPSGMQRPDAATLKNLAASIEFGIDKAAARSGAMKRDERSICESDNSNCRDSVILSLHGLFAEAQTRGRNGFLRLIELPSRLITVDFVFPALF